MNARRHSLQTILLLILLIMIALQAYAIASPPDFYFWQRRWTKEVQEAYEQSDRNLSIFAAELWKNKIERSDVPLDIWKNPRVRPVFRIHVDALTEKHIPDLVREIAATGANHVELDADVPESRLPAYVKFLKEVKRQLPKKVIGLSITALPCHVPHEIFKQVIAETDYYVLQIHGIEKPKSTSDTCLMINYEIAQRAINKAKSLHHPFKIALPTYAYVLNFDKSTGAFVSLQGEGNPSVHPKYTNRLVSTELILIRKLMDTYQNDSFIWFRHPVCRDKLNYDLSVIHTLESGSLPPPALEIEWKEKSPHTLELWVTPKNRIDLTIDLSLQWHHPQGETELPRQVQNTSPQQEFGILPSHLRLTLPGCGHPVRAATFLTPSTNIPQLKESTQP